jgi:hypothetical protein
MKTRLALWHLALRTDHLEKSLEAAVNAGCEVVVPIRPLDLLNDVTQKPWPVRVAFLSRPGWRINRTARRKTGYDPSAAMSHLASLQDTKFVVAMRTKHAEHPVAEIDKIGANSERSCDEFSKRLRASPVRLHDDRRGSPGGLLISSQRDLIVYGTEMRVAWVVAAFWTTRVAPRDEFQCGHLSGWLGEMTNSGPPFGPSPRPEANTLFLPPGLNFKISPAGRSPGISATYRFPAESNAIPRGAVKLLA